MLSSSQKRVIFDNDNDNDDDNENIFIAMNYSKQSVQETSPMISCFTDIIHFT